jgi:hypothetical protein
MTEVRLPSERRYGQEEGAPDGNHDADSIFAVESHGIA